MRVFVITIFVWFLLEAGGKAIGLSNNIYPKEISRTNAATSFFIFIGVAIWAGWLIF